MTINPTTGDVSVVTTALIATTTLTIRATNGGGVVRPLSRWRWSLHRAAKPELSGIALPDKLGLIRGTGATTQATAQAFTGTVTQYLVTGAG